MGRSTFDRAPSRMLTGGLNTASPATALPIDQSPDLQNVTLHEGAVTRRGGFPPLVRKLPKLNSIKNRGLHTRAGTVAAPSTNVEYLTVPGLLLAGNRAVQNAISDTFVIDFFVRPTDLTEQHGNSGAVSGPLTVRPILFKGPNKKTFNLAGVGPTASGSHMRWNQGAWGPPSAPAGTYAMPYGIYLYNTQNGSDFPWEFRFSVHNFVGGNWNLVTVQSAVQVRLDRMYHVIARCNFTTGRITLRISQLQDSLADMVYTTDTLSFTPGTAGVTTGPIQVFDCPQDFVEAPGAASPTRPPGLGEGVVPGTAYFYFARRFEGDIEDIAMHGSDLLDPGNTGSDTVIGAADRNTKLDPCDLPSSVLQFWSMTEPGEAVVKQMTPGHTNHLYLVPSGPVFNEIDGNARGDGSWWFDGVSSYALMNMRNCPSWLYIDGQDGFRPGGSPNEDMAAFKVAVCDNKPHGIEATIWPDAIEPGFEQVIMEAHSVLRLAINEDGFFVGYCRNDATGAGGGAAVPQYQATRVISTFQIQEGTRYTVALIRHNGGQNMDLWVNGQLAGTVGGLAPSDADGQPHNGLTVGMGSYRFTTYTGDTTTPVLPDAVTGHPNEINTDARSGFIGRVESCRVLMGSATKYPPYKDEISTDWHVIQNRLWETPNAAAPSPRDDFVADDPNDNIQDVGEGHVMSLSGDIVEGKPIRYIIEPPPLPPNHYDLPDAAPFGHTLRQFGAPGGMAQTYGRQGFLYHTLMRWVFNIDDRDIGDYGNYSEDFEIRNETGSRDDDYNKLVWNQQSEVTDELGVADNVIKRAVEMDWMTDESPDYSDQDSSMRHRPYRYRSPRELRPYWGRGLAVTRAGQTEITLLADWESEVGGERFLITAAGRQLFWARPAWRASTPFCDDPTDTRVAWGFGEIDSHIVVPGSSANQEWTTGTEVSVDLFFYPQRLDGVRMLVYKGDAEGWVPNFTAWLEDGVLHLFGAMIGQRGWHFEGTARSTLVKNNSWNHIRIYLRIAAAGSPAAWINGQLAALTPVAGFDVYGSAAAETPNGELYIGGLPEEYRDQTLIYGAGTSALQPRFESFRGMVTEFRLVQGSAEPAPWPDGVAIPHSRFTDDSSVWYLLHLNEGSGQEVIDSCANAGVSGRYELDDLVLIRENMAESAGGRYRHVVYRGELLITNGRSYPHRIAFRRFSYPGSPFEVRRLGVEQPAGETLFETVGSGTTSGLYSIWMSFLDSQGVEYEPVHLVDIDAAVNNFDSVRLYRLPRSPDPQITARRFYMSANGGGAPIERFTLPDNESRDVQIDPPTTGNGIVTGQRLPAPRARHIAVSEGSIWLANLTDVAVGQNTVQVSLGSEAGYWPGFGLTVIESQDGKPITAVRSHLGRTYLFKRDSSWEGSLAQFVGSPLPLPLIVNGSIGLGGAVVPYDDVLYGAGSKGVHLFNGSGVSYQSHGLEGDWRSLIDLSDDALQLFDGAYYWPDSQYWMSVRERGQKSSRLIYVLQSDQGTEVERQPQFPWTRMRVPEHTSLATILDPATSQPMLVLGTTTGQILVYSPELTVDCASDAGTLEGAATSTTSTSLFDSGATFDIASAGLKGATIRMTDTDGTVYERTIEHNTVNQVTWLDPITFVGDPTYEIGGYDSYWSSGWLAPQQLGNFLRTGFIDLEYAPVASELTLRVVSAIGVIPTERAFPASGGETYTIDMTNGWTEEPTRVRRDANRGRYARFRFGQRRPLHSFSVSSWQLREMQSGQRGGRST